MVGPRPLSPREQTNDPYRLGNNDRRRRDPGASTTRRPAKAAEGRLPGPEAIAVGRANPRQYGSGADSYDLGQRWIDSYRLGTGGIIANVVLDHLIAKPEDIADAVHYVVSLPLRLTVADIVVRPAKQLQF
jgi:hypothetical protein